MNGTLRVLAVGAATLLGLTAAADAKPDFFKAKSEEHGKEHHTAFKGDSHHADFKPLSHHSDFRPGFTEKHSFDLRGSYDHRKDDRHPRRKDDHHKPGGKFEHPKHRTYRERDQIEAFQHFWRNTGSFALSCAKNVWWSVISHWDHSPHGKIPYKPHGGYTPVDHGKPDHHKPDWDKPDWDKPDWNKPHNHDRPDKPGWHTPKPDCPEEPIPIPEPSSLPILISGLLMAAWMFRRGTKRLPKPN